MPEIVSTYPVTDDEMKASIQSEAVCSGALATCAHGLAGKAALYEKLKKLSADEISANRIKSCLEDFVTRIGADDMESLSRESLNEKLENLAILETAFENIAAQTITPDAVRSCVAANRIDWIKLAFDEIGFTGEDEAREGALCVREDGMSMAEVAADAQRPLRRTTLYIEDLGPELKSEFLACAEGELLGPLRWEGQHSLCLVIDKIMPDEAEPQIRQKAAQTILDTLVKREITDRVRWHFALE